MDISTIRVDVDAIENGAWVENIPESGDLRLKVRGFSSKAYSAFVARRVKTLERGDKERDGSPRPGVLAVITREAIVETILLDWSGVKDGAEEVPYSKEIAATLLADDELRFFRAAVEWAAGVVGK